MGIYLRASNGSAASISFGKMRENGIIVTKLDEAGIEATISVVVTWDSVMISLISAAQSASRCFKIHPPPEPPPLKYPSFISSPYVSRIARSFSYRNCTTLVEWAPISIPHIREGFLARKLNENFGRPSFLRNEKSMIKDGLLLLYLLWR